MYIFDGGEYSSERRIIGHSSIWEIAEEISEISDKIQKLKEARETLKKIRIAVGNTEKRDVFSCDDAEICDKIENIDKMTEKLSEQEYDLRNELKEVLWLTGTRTCTTAYPTTLIK